MFKRTREQSKPPIEADATIPPVLSDITVKCLQLDPTLRYQTALEIQRDIEAWRGGSNKRLDVPVQVEPEKEKPPRSRTTPLLVAAVVLVVAFGGAFVARKYFSRLLL